MALNTRPAITTKLSRIEIKWLKYQPQLQQQQQHQMNIVSMINDNYS